MTIKMITAKETVMKKCLSQLLILVLLLGLSACAKTPVLSETVPTVKPINILNATIAELDEQTMLLAGSDVSAEAEDVYMVSTSVQVFDKEGNAADASILRPGMSITLEYDGNIAETYPMLLLGAKKISVISDEGDLIGFYRGILRELMETDPALNEGAEVIGFDFSALDNLRESEKAALMYLASQDAGLEYVSGTADELTELGYIDKNRGEFINGVLIELETADEKSESFTFSVSKWRSGTGAIGNDSCRAKRQNGVWSYEPGAQWIS